MKLNKVILGIISFLISLLGFYYTYYFLLTPNFSFWFLASYLLGLFFLGLSLLFLKIRTSILEAFGGLLGIIAIFSVIINFPIAIRALEDKLTIPGGIVSVIASLIVVSVGVLVLFPLSRYKNIFFRKIGYLISGITIIYIIFDLFFFLKLAPFGVYAGDFSVIPFFALISLFFGSLCVPFLIVKLITTFTKLS